MKILWQSSTIMYLKSSENHETRIIAIDSSCWWDHHYSTPKLVQMHTFYSVFRAQKPSQCLCSHQSHTFVIVPWRRRFFNDCLSGGRLGHQGADPLADGFSIAQAFPERWLWTCSLLLSLSSEETKKYLWDLFPTLEKTATVGYPAVAGPTEISSSAQGKRGSFHPRGDSEFETEHTLSKKDLLGNRSRNAKGWELGKGPQVGTWCLLYTCGSRDPEKAGELPEAAQHGGDLSGKKARWCVEPASPQEEDNRNVEF